MRVKVFGVIGRVEGPLFTSTGVVRVVLPDGSRVLCDITEVELCRS